MRGVMTRAGGAVQPVSIQVSDPFKQRGVANVAVVFELSDGQTISIYFHNPDVTPQKMAPTDEIISWKWMLNKKDITIVVAPERGKDLSVREVARRIMKLAEKNSKGFARANAKRTERMKNIQSLKDEIVALEEELVIVQGELEVAKNKAEGKQVAREAMHIAVREALSKIGWQGFENGDAMTINDYRVSESGYDSFAVERLDRESGVWEVIGGVSVDTSNTAQQIAEEIVYITSSKAENIDPASPEATPKSWRMRRCSLSIRMYWIRFFKEGLLLLGILCAILVGMGRRTRRFLAKQLATQFIS